MADPAGNVTVSFSGDPASAAQLSKVVEDAIANGFSRAFASANFNKVMNEAGKAVKSSFDSKTFDAITQEFKGVTQEVTTLIGALRKVGEETTTVNQAVRSTFSVRKTEIEALGKETAVIGQGTAQKELAILKASSAEQLQVQRAALDEQGRAQKVAGELAVTAAKSSAKERLALTRGFVDAAVALEKGLGTAIEAVAKTATSAVSRTFSGLGSALKTVFSRSNSEVTEGLNSSLNKREEILRSSFRTQQNIVSESVTKQEVLLTQFREQTSHGLAGVAQRAGILGGGILLGAGIAQLARSTFSVGSDFVRGLAVLQQQLGLTDDQMKEVRKTSIALGNDISLPGVSAKDAAEAVQILTKQFGALGPAAVDAATAAAKGTLQLSRATGSSAEDAAAIIGSAVNVFGIAADQATFVADEISGALSKAAGVGFQDFKESFTQAASVFSSFEVPAIGAKDSLLEFNTALAVLAKGGLTGESAGAALKQFFISATKGSKKVQDELRGIAKAGGATGTVFFDADGKARRFSDSIDILRKGLAGQTQQQKISTLTTIFGSRAIQAANLLLGTSSEEYLKLRDSIQVQGLAAKIAAAQNTGLKGSLDALSSVLETLQILFYEKIQPFLSTFVLDIAKLTNNIFFSSGAWAVVRQGLLGAAVGLAAIIAAKGAIEVIQLLGLAFKALLTPMGLFLVGAAAIGAIFSILYQNSESFRDATHQLWAELQALGKILINFIKPYLDSLAKFIQTTVIPAIERLAIYVSDHFVGALHILGGFITGTIVPALVAFYRVIANFVIPIAIRVGDIVASAFSTALDAVKGFASFTLAFIQPMIDGFKQLGSSIGAAFSGDFSKLLGGLGSAGTGIAQVATRIGENIYDALKPVGQKILDFFKNLFTVTNVQKAFGGLLTAVEFVGKIVAEIATNPKVLTAIATAAGILGIAAAQIGFHLIKGIIEGIETNLPGLGDLLIKVVKKLLTLAFDPSVIIPVIIAGFAFTRLIQPLIATFKGLGAQSAGGFVSGFKSVGTAASDFVGTLFGVGLPGSSLRGANSALNQEIRETQQQLRILGSTKVVNLENIDEGKRELTQLRTQFSSAEVAALQMKDHVSGALTAITGTIGQLGKAIGAGFRGSLSGVKDAFAGLANGLSQVAEEQGKTVGAYLGKGIAVGALAAVGGFAAGQQAGKAGINPLISALTVGIGASALSGGDPIVGVIAGGASLIGSAFGSASKKAEEFRGKVKDLANALKSDLGPSLKDAAGQTLTLRDALDNKGSDSSFVQKLFDQLGNDNIRKLQSLGISLGDITTAFEDGDTAVAALNQRIATLGGTSSINKSTGRTGALPVFQHQIDAINSAYKTTAAALKDVNTQQSALNSVRKVSTKQDLVDQKSAQNVAALAESYRQLALGVSGVSGTGAVLAVDQVDTRLHDFQTTIDDAQTALTNLFNPPTTGGSFQAIIDQQILAVQSLGAQIQGVISQGGATGQGTIVGDAQIRQLEAQIESSLGTAVQAGVNAGLIVDPDTARVYTASLLQASLAGITDPTVISAITDAYNTGIANVGTIVPTIDGAKVGQTTQQAIQDYLAQHPFDPAINGTPAATQFVADMVAYFSAHPIDPQVNPNSAVAIAQAKQLASNLATSVNTALNQGNGAHAAGVNVSAGFAQGITDSKKLATEAAAGVAAAAAKIMNTVLGINSPSKVTMEVGAGVAEGLALGIRLGQPAVVSQATTLVAGLADAMASGVKDGTTDLANLFSTGVNNAIDAAINAAQKGAAPLNAAIAALFGGLSGSHALSGGGQVGAVPAALSAITQAIQGVATNFDSVVSTALQTGAIDPSKRSAAQQRIAAGSVFSLNPNDVLGAQNLASFSSALDTISQLGQVLLGQGQAPSAVASQLKPFVDQLVALSSQLGFSFNDIYNLVNSFGLTDSALQSFVASANTAASSFNAAAAAASANAAAQDAQTAAVQANVDYTLDQLPRTPVIVQVYPQNGDPAAIGLASANAVAAATLGGFAH